MNIEPLESRIAPAAVITSVDLDGDRVTITASTAGLTVNEETAPDGRHTVFSIELTGANVDGTSLTVSVVKGKVGSTPGDGKVIIGTIQAGAHNLGKIKIEGDLGDIDAGSGPGSPAAGAVTAIKSLTVDSFGRFGQRGEDDAFSQINGNVGSLVVKGDLIATAFFVTGNLDSVSIGGSVIGGPADGDGEIYATGSLGKVTVKKDLRGALGDYSGSIGAGRDVGSVAIGGSIYGGSGDNSGHVYSSFVADGKITKVTVGRSVFGGSGNLSGAIGGYKFDSPLSAKETDIGAVSIGKDLVGGEGDRAGTVFPRFGDLGQLSLKGSLVGGSGDEAGTVLALDVTKLSIGGSIYGGTGSSSGRLSVSKAGTITLGSLYGGSGSLAGSIDALALGIDVLKIRGDVVGGNGASSGRVEVTGDLLSATIGGSITGGLGNYSGNLHALGGLGSITVGHDLRGAAGNYSGSIGAGLDVASVKIGGSIYGSLGKNSGYVFSSESGTLSRIETITVAGSVIGGEGELSGVIGGHPTNGVTGGRIDFGTVFIGKDLVGGKGVNSGSVNADLGGVISKSLTVKGSLIGGGGTKSGTILAAFAKSTTIGGSIHGGNGTTSGAVEMAAIETISLGGSLYGGTEEHAGSIRTTAAGIAVLKIKGDVRGSSGDSSGRVEIANHQFTGFILGEIIPGTGTSSGTVG